MAVLDRQDDSKLRSFSQRASNADAASMRTGDLSADVKTKPICAFASGAGSSTTERLEE
jgi:hypothetical protein